MRTAGKLAIIFGVIAVTALGAAAVVFFGPVRNGIVSAVNLENNDFRTVKTVPVEGAESISVDTSSTDIQIEVSDEGNEIRAELKGVFRGKPDSAPVLTVEKNGSAVLIQVKWPPFHPLTGIHFSDLNLAVTVPGSFHGALKAETSSGDIHAGPCTFRQLSGKTSSGDIRLGNIQAEETVLLTSSGDISIASVTGETFQSECSSGSLDADKISVKHIMCKTSSGDIGIAEAAGSLEFSTSSGGAEIGYLDFDHAEINGRSSSGDIVLTLPESAAFRINLRTSSGRLTSDFPVTMQVQGKVDHNILKGTVSGGNGLVELRSSSGNISVRKQP